MPDSTLLDQSPVFSATPAELLSEMPVVVAATPEPQVAYSYKVKDKWLKEAVRRIAPAYKVKPADQMPMARNKLINRGYTEIYNLDPFTFKWAGAAAFASHSAGKKMELLKQLNGVSRISLLVSFGTALPLWLASSELGYLFKAVALGNKAIYLDIFWQHLAYVNGGIAELEEAHRQGDFSEKLLQTWKTLDEGRKTRNEKLIWQANMELLEHEQKDVIQPILYEGERNRLVWELVCTTDVLFGGLVTSPVPEETRGFRDCVPNGNLADYDQRWKWCIEQIMPGWRAYEAKNPQKVKALLKQITR